MSDGDLSIPEARFLRRLVLTIVYVVAGALVLFVSVMKPPGINGNPRAEVPEMIQGTAHRPFVYRRLVPETAALLTRAAPGWLKESLTAVMSEPKREGVLSYLKWERKDLVSYGMIMTLILGCYVGFALLLRRMLRRLYDLPGPVVDFAPLTALILLPALFRAVPPVYDPGTLLTFTGAFACLVERRTLLFYPALALASLNKETAVLLIPLFALRYHREMKPAAIAGHGLAQGLLWLAITAAIRWVHRSNPGNVVEFHLLDHNLVLFREPVYFAYFLVLFGVGGLLLRGSWSGAPPFLRRSFVLLFGPLFLALLIMGFIDEARAYLEAWPLFCLIVIPGVVRLYHPPSPVAGLGTDTK